jgi:uncharacterized membrane protein (UPF0127 family)
VKVVVASSGVVLAERVRVASGPRERMKGLLGGPPLERGDALLLSPASQVHTFGMKYPIDVVFADGGGRVVHVVRNMKPRRISKWVRGAKTVLELAAGSVPNDVVPGTALDL